MKTQEELNILKAEVTAVNEKLSKLTEEELEQVTGGGNYELEFEPEPDLEAPPELEEPDESINILDQLKDKDALKLNAYYSRGPLRSQKF